MLLFYEDNILNSYRLKKDKTHGVEFGIKIANFQMLKEKEIINFVYSSFVAVCSSVLLCNDRVMYAQHSISHTSMFFIVRWMAPYRFKFSKS